MRNWSKIRNAGLCATCALMLVLPAAQGQETTSSTKKPVPAKKSTAKKASSHKSNTTHTAATSSASKKSVHRTGASSHTTTGKRSSRKKVTKVRGQQKIDSERAQAIQGALIREHYLSPDAGNGEWNQASEDAMRRYQEDHGWQTKEVPDSRALIRLGLGPSKDGLLNPESAMTTVPDAPKAESLPTNSHSGDPPSSTNSPNNQ